MLGGETGACQCVLACDRGSDLICRDLPSLCYVLGHDQGARKWLGQVRGLLGLVLDMCRGGNRGAYECRLLPRVLLCRGRLSELWPVCGAAAADAFVIAAV